MTSCISCGNCYVERSSAEGRVGRAGDGDGETGRAGDNGKDVSDDDGSSGGDGDGGSFDSIGRTTCA